MRRYENLSEFIEHLKVEAIAELRRAAEDLAYSTEMDLLAEIYASTEPYTPCEELIRQFCRETTEWFKRIPVEVRWVKDGQPFSTCGEMRHFVREHHFLPMYAAPSVLCSTYHKHRAVHDWFGHIETGIPFGAIGELAAYRVHKPMYSEELHPLIFSDVVLNNVYFEVNGKFFSSEKYVKLDDRIIRSH